MEGRKTKTLPNLALMAPTAILIPFLDIFVYMLFTVLHRIVLWCFLCWCMGKNVVFKNFPLIRL